ncbi:MAG: GNAT family N-acetyltransferase [Candidatus Bathyarchaeota archaeon]|nr:GNAT family N-acetyltransferase [Candidatus Bathyarchaeota archaeon]
MEIRRLAINNYGEMVRLWIKTKLPFKPEGRDSREAIATQMKANPEFFLGALEDNRLVGSVIISSDSRKGWINRLVVDPGFRRRGVAKALIAGSEKVLRRHGIRIFCVLIEDYNTVSKKLFKECNYVEGRDVIYFSKRDSNEV